MSPRDIVAFAVSHAGAVQCAFFIAVLAVTWVVEWRALKVSAIEKAAHTYTNVLLLICGMPVQLAMTAIVLAVAAGVSAHHWGLAYLLAGGQPVSWVQIICELQRDWNRKDTAAEFAKILFATEGK